ncbi:hypothetical protein [Amycolatopsis regifaucium]|nr:hypothetical protein [Amycolatopsis regifaucium]
MPPHVSYELTTMGRT